MNAIDLTDVSTLLNAVRRSLLAALLLLLPAIADAQCSTTFYSLESRICVANRVYYGSISDIRRTETVPPNGFRNGSQFSDGFAEYALTINVDEFLKGPESKTVTLVAERRGYDKLFERIAERNLKLLFFVTDVEQAEGRKPLENRWPDPWTFLILAKPAPGEDSYGSLAPPIFAKDVSVLREPEDVLKRARDFAKRYRENLSVHSFDIPHPTVRLCSVPCDANFLVVPIDPELEETAKRMMATPRDFVAEKQIDKFVPDRLRLAAAGALRHFPSQRNQRLLTSLLNDPMRVGQYNEKLQRADVWVYPIRKEAWNILKSWKVDVPKPVLEQRIPDPPIPDV